MVSVIKGLGVYIPPFYDKVDDLAKYLGASQENISTLKQIIGPHESIAVADMTYMDSTVLALNAFENMRRTSESLGLQADYRNVQIIFGGTENPPDKSKPTMALEIGEKFGISPNTLPMTSTAACSVGGGTLFAAQSMGIEAIVAMADIATYDPKAHNAYKKLATAGAGGAVFHIGTYKAGKDDWLIWLYGSEGFYNKSVKDFYVPNGSRHPVVSGLLSCWCYDLGILGAIADHFKKLDEKGGEKSVEERLASYRMFVPHIPFIKQSEEAFCLLYSGRINEKIKTLEEAINKEEKNLGTKSHRKPVMEMIEEARKTPGVMDEFKRLTQYWQDLPIQIGNPYSASLPAALAFGLQNMEEQSEPFDVLLAFFGSGLQAIAMSARMHPKAIEYAKELDVAKMIEEKNRIIILPEKYIKNISEENPKPFDFPPKGYFMRKSPVERGYPKYERLEKI